MTFANPVAFLGLLAIVPLILIYLFKEHTSILAVPSMLFWRKLEQHPQASKSLSLQRFLSHPLFWIQLLILLVVVGALAEPQWEQSARKIAIVMDVSASMQTRESEGSRLDLAKEQAYALIDEMEPLDRMILISVGIRPEVVFGFSTDKKALSSAVDSLVATDTSADIDEIFSFITSLGDSSESIDVIVLSDQSLDNRIGSAANAAFRFSSRVVGSTGENTGFVAINQQVGLAGIQGTSGDLLLRNYVPETRSGTLLLSQAGETIMEAVVDLPPSASVPVRIGQLVGDGPVTAEFRIADSLDVDNQVVFLPTTISMPSMRVWTSDDTFSSLCRQLDGYRVTVRPPETADKDDEQFDINLYDGIQPDSMPPGGVVVVDAPGNGRPNLEQGFYDWKSDHPILNGLVLDGISLAGASAFGDIPGWSEVLAQTKTFPVVFSGAPDGHRRVVMSLDIAEQLDNPSALLILLKSLSWVNPKSAATESHIRTGEIYTYIVADTVNHVEVVSPRGVVRTVTPIAGAIAYSDTYDSGLYEARIGGETRYFVANMLDPEESDIRVFRRSNTQADERISSSTQAAVSTPYWRIFLWLFLVLITIEWAMDFMRRETTQPG
jgi:hypothetical protein